MIDLAMLGMGLMAAGGTVAAVCASTMMFDARAELADLQWRYDMMVKNFSTPVELTADDIVQPHVMCGACGMSAPLMADGFTISPHDCDSPDFFDRYANKGLRSSEI